ncbi:MAG: TIGR01458 family HAD-type hydrolase [gamma proteobacterium symbiont of Bathyaustriella thionipta]|nr:TIGR01458 family HAD-type hydrolase [gamma proteobacterium symbiont of Bathyaustriella thionipta]MCU7951394.1 TIGR01458 family HAD-type hydrolase [gamma proteobacterium symbiont of Bathyaustriella thionipta]MCU7951962.1 TIGR01458 family HAD-type hydrolase [gamma proteobacterium symbiont of Bathyaustriella thionipta]MCU7957944.1 TIGR01458 family HAD-type hydrolase [gamma proteobacterium symbiont of Bathyaustriella thionipta]MCU7966559.1 TIGR01458 family HAD-type hydrolase [gamma proteobacteri
MIRAVLLDLSGVLYIGGKLIPGAVEAIERLYQTNIPLRFITNTTRRSHMMVYKDLQKIGFHIELDSIYTPVRAVINYLKDHKLHPHLLVHPNIQGEFDDLMTQSPDAVVLGDAAEYFNYTVLNDAFRLLMKGAPLIAMGNNRYFREPTGLSLDLGPFVTALEYATQTNAIIIGKPSADFFSQVYCDFGVEKEYIIMFGDDYASDTLGALATGLQGGLVKTGKYQKGDENKLAGSGAIIVNNISEAADWCLSHYQPELY